MVVIQSEDFKLNKAINFSIDNKIFNLAIVEEMQFTVQSRLHSYLVKWDHVNNPQANINAILSQNEENVLCIDKQVYELYGEDFKVPDHRIFQIDANEEFKSFIGLEKILDFFNQRKLSKSSNVLVVGGGITQDLCGFAAAIYKRGLSWIFFPTTLLAMCDSCIGAKTAINFHQVKNQVGLFTAPKEIIIHPQFLESLSDEALLSGLGEILKLCIIAGDKLLTIFEDCIVSGKIKDRQSYQRLILLSLKIKKTVIEEDEFEKNYRKVLNYGHTLGHAIETLTNYEIPHGMAVVFGMLLVNEFAYQKNILSNSDRLRLLGLFKGIMDQKYIRLFSQLNSNEFLTLIKNDKKVENNFINLIVAKKPGMFIFESTKIDEKLNHQLKELTLNAFNQLADVFKTKESVI